MNKILNYISDQFVFWNLKKISCGYLNLVNTRGEEYFFGEGVSVVEWADKIPEAFPGSHLSISIMYNKDDSRELQLKAYGDRYKLLIQDLRQPLRKFK